MPEYVEREKVNAAFNKAYDDATDGDIETLALGFEVEMESIPTADVRPVVRGHWVEDESGCQVCSECGAEHEWINYRANFCEDCGADMRRGNA